MSVAREELEEFRDDALSDAARQAFRASAEATSRWDRAHPLYRPWPLRIGAVLALALVAELAWALMRTPGIRDGVGLQTAGISDVGELGEVLFTDYMFAFEVTSILILASMVGAVILTRKQSE